MKKITIFGVGLMGGSLALCFKGKPGLHVIGHSNRQQSVEKYLQHGVVDEATTSFEDAATDADFIFLCGPVGILEEYLIRLQGLKLKSGCIISDVGSTKFSVMQCADKLSFGEAYFIGGHPMAGSERSGVEAATAHLYENAFYVLTPSANTPPDVYERLVGLLGYTKAQMIRLDPLAHDDIVGAISHLPHVIAVALVNMIARYNDHNPFYKSLAAGGFRDLTRIASGEQVMWRDILIDNRDVMLKLLKEWKMEIDLFIELLHNRDGQAIEEAFHTAGNFRSAIPERGKGMITSAYDIYVDVEDQPGVIGDIASLLGSHKVNLSNIQIMESRMDVPGVLRLSFRDQDNLDRAVKLLQASYHIHL